MRDLSWLDKLSDSDVSALREYARYIFPGQIDEDLDFLELYCPQCKDTWTVDAFAKPGGQTYVRTPAVIQKSQAYATLAWELTEADCEFEYVCSNCGQVHAMSLHKLQDMWKKEKENVHNS